MSTPYRILILGASYGSLLATKLALAGHDATMVCRQEEADAFNSEGAIIRMPVKGREGLVEVRSKGQPGKLAGVTPDRASLAGVDLVVLGMQEPQYGSPGVRELLQAIAAAKLPCMSIMNMPPLPYLKRIAGISAEACRAAYTDPAVWDDFDPDLMTLCSPDPQAFRPPEEKINVLQVRLPTNFKSARFVSDAHTAILKKLEADIEAVRFAVDGQSIELPVKLKVYDSVFVPLAKWSMLLAGNYRCVQAEAARPIRDAVHGNPAQSRAVYEWVADLCVSLGADRADLVPFDKYANAAQGLASPSSAARALFAGAKNIERVDRLVQAIAAQKGRHNDEVDAVVKLVDARLALNRSAA